MDDTYAQPVERARKWLEERPRYGFEDMCLHKVTLTVVTENHAARRVYVKVGFVEEGRLRQVFAVTASGTTCSRWGCWQASSAEARFRSGSRSATIHSWGGEIRRTSREPDWSR